jgi:SpoVK/Ycf46/Vps4 family AAA+-type ATPase
VINVLVAAVKSDVQAEGIAKAVAARSDMHLLEGRNVLASEVDGLLPSVPATPPCALIVVGQPSDTNAYAERWLAARADLVVMYVAVIGDMVRVGVRRPELDSLLTALRVLVERVGTEGGGQVARFHVRQAGASPAPAQRPLLEASIDWVHRLLRDAVENVPDGHDEAHGLTINKSTLLQSLDATPGRDDQAAELMAALAGADPKTEPLAAAAAVFDLDPLEFRMMALALSPELDPRFQRCMGFLLDEAGRRVGSMSLYSSLLGAAARVRGELGHLSRWHVFEGDASRPAAADEPLRLDPFLAQWLLGDRDALAQDPRIRRAIRLVPWSGAALLDRPDEHARAAALLDATRWRILGGDDPAGWRALFELGGRVLIRVEITRLAGLDINEVEDCALRLARMARLTDERLVLDATGEAEGDGLRVFLGTLDRARCHAAVICSDAARIMKLLGPEASYELAGEPPLPASARIAAVRAAATGAEVYLPEDAAEAIANRYPLGVDRLEHAMRLALERPKNFEEDDPRLARFTAALREIAAEGISNIAERIEPVFSLDDVVLPPDRKQQLGEIVDHVRLAPRVLDEWKFREQLPYGRGVTALFFGPSGTGKTMAALGIAHRLGVQLLRLDFSRVVSKYIGDTEKNIDRVFSDAQRSGSAILIDEADALLGKRSEVKDAHDRYANIEVAYLLQRMEAYEGLAILTTNMRQNLDAAFLRRLRFVVDFPRPDVEAREKIWRLCLPTESHVLDEAAFRLLARKIDLTGGHIRQITLRAAFIAAAAGVQIGLEHLAQAARAEFAKLGMPPIEIDLAQGRRAA